MAVLIIRLKLLEKIMPVNYIYVVSRRFFPQNAKNLKKTLKKCKFSAFYDTTIKRMLDKK